MKTTEQNCLVNRLETYEDSSLLAKKEALTKAIEEASQILPLIWPLQGFIASNPLRDLETLEFSTAINTALEFYHHPFQSKEVTQKINRLMIKWCQIFFDTGQAALKCMDQNDDYYSAWRKIQPYDPEISAVDPLPSDPLVLIESILDSLKIPQAQWASFFKIQFAALPGWGGWIKRHVAFDESTTKATLTQFLAIRLSLFQHFDGSIPHQQPGFYSKPLLKEIKAAEAIFNEEILSNIPDHSSQSDTTPSAQWVFCIDPRSEPIRRHLEQVGPNETFGFAGFFGIPLAVKTRLDTCSRSACPVILKPTHLVHEKGVDGTQSQLSKSERAFKAFRELFYTFKKSLWTPFALVETAGLFSGLISLCSTLFPKTISHFKNSLRDQSSTHFTPSEDEINTESAVSFSENFLKSIGLTQNFAKEIVLCGHRSDTTNNPHASALQCGACSGHGGMANAQVMASLLNKKQIRDRLKEKGLLIPKETQFIAAVHETTTDAVLFASPSSASKELIQYTQEATARAQEEKKEALGLPQTKKNLANQISKRGALWSENRPEWGLARNAGFIVAPRKRTKGMELNRRCFLHCYDHNGDPEGTTLQAILGGPVTVAHWINMQYLFSTLCPALFGGGSKVTHNITGRFGLMQGNGSDLMHGLPLQSLYRDDETREHAPTRLHLVIEAPKKVVEKALDSCPSIRTALDNQWMHLTVIDQPLS
ncbi:MAG: Na-translocating system protein MpsB [Simkaniaceae bacterium]|nr:Na-translocating system protein MpsB [Candidatus Sacchlamyda saccharinae]